MENSRKRPARLRGSGGVKREKKGRVRKEKRKTKRDQPRVYDVTQVTYEIIIGFRDLYASRCCAAALARRWLAFHITFAAFAARTRLFSTCTLQTHPLSPRIPAHLRVFLHFSLHISHLDDRASYCLLSFVCENLRAVLIITIILHVPT